MNAAKSLNPDRLRQGAHALMRIVGLGSNPRYTGILFTTEQRKRRKKTKLRFEKKPFAFFNDKILFSNHPEANYGFSRLTPGHHLQISVHRKVFRTAGVVFLTV